MTPLVSASTLGAIRTVAAPVTLTTGALFYFGWVRTRAVANYFGIDPELLGYSSADYILRSVSTVFPLSVIAAATTLATRRGWSRVVLRCGTDRESVRRLGRQATLLGWTLAVPGLAFLALFPQLLGVGNMWAANGPLLTIPAIFLISAGHRLETAHGVRPNGSLIGGTGLTPIVSVSLGAIGVAALFAGVFLSANAIGTLTAHNRARNLADEPRVVLTSQTELHLFGQGAGTVLRDNGELSEPWSRRYDDLRLWVEANGRWFLVPSNWQNNRVVHIVEIDSTVRLDIDERGT